MNVIIFPVLSSCLESEIHTYIQKRLPCYKIVYDWVYNGPKPSNIVPPPFRRSGKRYISCSGPIWKLGLYGIIILIASGLHQTKCCLSLVICIKILYLSLVACINKVCLSFIWDYYEDTWTRKYLLGHNSCIHFENSANQGTEKTARGIWVENGLWPYLSQKSS